MQTNQTAGSKILFYVVYNVLPGKRKEFYNALCEAGIPRQSRAEKGNLRYEYFFSAESENQVLLIELWDDPASQDEHRETPHFKKLQKIKETYVTDVKMEKYTVC